MAAVRDKPQLWIRSEVRASERRAPLVPQHARFLLSRGIPVTVEHCPQRVFPTYEYAAAGCRIAEPGGWVQAPGQAYIVGLKELPNSPALLRHRHVFFGHAYKGQAGSTELLRRFVAGGGALLDLEYLVDSNGHRLVAFGYWAGYAGAALAVLHHAGRLHPPLRPQSKGKLDAALARAHPQRPPRVLVIGAFGRCGRGARDALAVAGVQPTCWGAGDTRVLDRAALLGHDILINAVHTTRPVPPFLTTADLDDSARRLSLIVDVTCDLTSPTNVLPINDSPTTWGEPLRRLRPDPRPLDIIAIDNLPSLLPREASVDFSAQLWPHLATLGSEAPPWQRCLAAFHAACHRAGLAVCAGPRG